MWDFYFGLGLPGFFVSLKSWSLKNRDGWKYDQQKAKSKGQIFHDVCFCVPTRDLQGWGGEQKKSTFNIILGKGEYPKSFFLGSICSSVF